MTNQQSSYYPPQNGWDGGEGHTQAWEAPAGRTQEWGAADSHAQSQAGASQNAQSVPYTSSTAKARAQAPVAPPAPDFSQMPSQGKKTRPGVVVGIVAGCLVLALGLFAGINALASRAVEDLADRFLGGSFAQRLDDWHADGSDRWDIDDWDDFDDLDDLFDYYHDFDNEGSGGAGPASNDPAADDGELHDAWNNKVSYRYTESSYDYEALLEHVDAYDMDLSIGFDVDFPQLEGDLEHLDAINEAIRAEAMDFATRAYLEPDPSFVSMVKGLAESDGLGEDEEGPVIAQGLIEQDLDYAITYNSDKLISIVFSDSYCAGSMYARFLQARTLNINLETGEAYTIDDVMEVTQEAAEHWVDNLEASSASDVVADAGYDTLVASILGKGDAAGRTSTGFFVDANGKVNLNVNWWLAASDGGSRGWWDVTLTDDELAKAKKDSSFWEALG